MSEAKYREYLQVTRNADSAQMLLDSIFDAMKNALGFLPEGEKMIARVQELMTVEALTDRVVALAAPMYDDAALDAAIAFYKSPEGQRFLASGKAASNAGLIAGQSLGADLAQKVLKEFGIAEEP